MTRAASVNVLFSETVEHGDVGDLIENGWSNPEEASGEAYIARIAAAGRTGVLRRVYPLLAPKTQHVRSRFADKHGWGDDGAELADRVRDAVEQAAEEPRPREPAAVPVGEGGRAEAGARVEPAGGEGAERRGADTRRGRVDGGGLQGDGRGFNRFFADVAEAQVMYAKGHRLPWACSEVLSGGWSPAMS